MSRLPGFMKDSLSTIASPTARPEEMVTAVTGLLDTERRLEALSRAVEAYREASRSLGILDESRSGQRVCDSWAKLSRFFLAPLLGGSNVFAGKMTDQEQVPAGYEAIGARWERLIPEIEAFVLEEKTLERLFAESPVSAHVGFGFRSRLLLLDRRAERIKVGLDLLRRDLTQAARTGLEHLALSLGARPRGVGRGAPAADGSGAAT